MVANILHISIQALVTAALRDPNFRTYNEIGPRRIFLPKARVLSQDELGSLSEQEKAFANECKDRGIWLELFCPDEACFAEEERIKLPVFCEHSNHKHSLWIDIFCPGGSCEVTDASKLP